MPIISIDSIDDSRILPFRDLPRSKLPKHAGLFIAEGAYLVEELLASDFQVDSLFVERPRAEGFHAKVQEDVPVYVADRQLFRDVIGYSFHRCVLACGRRRQHPSFEGLLPDLPPAATVVVCHDIHDPENLGGVIRNCAAFGVDAVLLSSQCTDPFSRRVLRVSMGTVFKLALAESKNLSSDLIRLRDHQFQILGTVLDPAAEPLETVQRRERLALLLGNEAHGVDDNLVQHCDQQVTIPMRLNTDSLNVAVASGIFLYHFSRPNNLTQNQHAQP